MRALMILAGLLLATGCASITKGTKDTVNVEIGNCSESMLCKATNKKGTWEFRAPGPVTVVKSDDALVLRCEDGPHVLTRTIAPDNSGMAWGNVVFGGVVGAAVDSGTDAHWDLPDVVTLARRTCRGETIEGEGQ